MTLQGGRDVGAGNVALRFAGSEILDAEFGGFAIPLGHLVDNAHSLLVASLAHEILGRLEDSEGDKTDQEHEQRQPTQRDEKIPPPHVLRLGARLLLLLAGVVAQQRPRDEVGDDLGDGPVHGQHRQQVLVRGREELEEDGRVDGEVPAHAKGPQRGEGGDGGEVGASRRDETPDGGEAEGQVEAPFAAEDVAAEAPEGGADEEADVLRQREEGGSVGRELVGDGREEEGRHNGPHVVAGPAEADDDEELPLVPSHANILDLSQIGTPR